MDLSDNPYLYFVPPPEAPVFTPTEEEFRDTLGYISKIKPIAEKSGICKIKPPPDWQPPFAVDVETFKFVPRIQKLNELEAKTRIKLNFLDQLARFWELQGCALRIPHVERKLLDLYTLYKMVEDEGGMEVVCKERKWSKIAMRMNFPSGKGLGSILRSHYEKLLYPFYLFRNNGAEVGCHMLKQSIKLEKDDDEKDADYKPHGVSSEVEGGFTRKSKRSVPEAAVIDYSANSELKKLQFFGAGPKAAVPSTTVKDEKPDTKDSQEVLTVKTKSRLEHISSVDAYVCHVCDRGDGEEHMLLCDGCDDAFHTYCLVPPMPEVPKGDWRCPKCVKQACNKPSDPYGFEQSSCEYTLQSFGEMADQFKSDYFNMPVHMVSFEQVEKEFWRLVNTIEEEVAVQYGADIHAAERGSGFPTKQNKDKFPEDEEYVISGWNLNNLPVLEQSVLCHINADISGMKIPWCYVGMCFSCFCWHNEDHWSYSINYMHWGEPKTWYGVPGSCATQFESAMKKVAPELFEQAPDLLHQLTTIMNPNILMEQGVPIVRTNQCAGEFVVTFPRAYHAGFNQGYNFAEAVNFCPADWLPIGRECIDHYRSLHRQCVFSHEELICKMAADPDSLDFHLAAATHLDMLTMVESEKKLRKLLLDMGTTDAEREAFELLPDDERQCMYCKTTCFLSAVTCNCTPNKVVCIHHVEHLCTCPPSQHCLRYRYTLDELPAMLHRLKVRAECFDNWRTGVKRALEASSDEKLDILDLKELINEADEKHFPESELLQTLVNSVSEAEKCAHVANQLVTKKVRTRHRQSGEGKYVAKLSLDELKCFYEQVTNLPCKIREAKLIKDLLTKVTDFQTDAREALQEETPDSEKLEKLIDFGVTLDVDLPEIPKLKQVLQQAQWLDEVKHAAREPQNVTLEVMRKLIESGVSLAPHAAVEKAMADLQELLTISERWEEKARLCLQARPRHVMATLETIISEAKDIPAYLPNVCCLKEALRKAKEWTSKVEAVQNCNLYPYLDVLENLVNKGRPIPVRLDQLPQVESQVSAAKSWRERTARTFLKKNSTYTLLEVLSPRTDVGIYSSGRSKKKKLKDAEKEKEKKEFESNGVLDFRIEQHRNPAAIVAAFKTAEQREIEAMKELRDRNMEKHRQSDDVKYCVCRKGASGFMLQCELCKDWFHGSCVPLPKSSNIKNKNSQVALMQAARDLKFLCPLCLRSRRPRLETILSLLVSLQKLPVRLPEGEALQCLTERAMAWQDKARQALATTELAAALAKLSLLSQRMVEQAAREKTEKIINAELMKAANNPELQGHLATVTQSAFGGVQSSQREFGTLSMDTNSSQSMQFSPGSPQSLDEPSLEQELFNGHNTGMSSEHAYSSASKTNLGVSPRKHQRKSPLVPRQLETPVLELSETAKTQLEDLMMDGDLLEVSLDETQHIWRILQACQTRSDEKFMEFEDSSEGISMKEKPEKMKVKSKDKEKERKKRKKKDGDHAEGLEIIKMKKSKDDDLVKPKKKNKDKDVKPKVKEKEKVKTKDVIAIPGVVEKVKKEEKVKKKIKKTSTTKEKKDKMSSARKEKRSKSKDGGISSVEDGEAENDDDCSALKCLKPIGEEVNWVQCDHCELWFHLLCVGLADDDVNEEEDYVCFRCKDGGLQIDQESESPDILNTLNFPMADESADTEDRLIRDEDDGLLLLDGEETADINVMDSKTVNEEENQEVVEEEVDVDEEELPVEMHVVNDPPSDLDTLLKDTSVNTDIEEVS